VFKTGVATLLLGVAFYLSGIVTVSALESSPNAQIKAGAWFFLIGSCVALIAAILIPFGYGWKRVPLVIACILSLFFWYGFTLY
jgi:hypothetical protein